MHRIRFYLELGGLTIASIYAFVYFVIESVDTFQSTDTIGDAYFGFLSTAWYALGYFFAVASVIMLIEMAMSRWRRIRVFMSYQNKYESVAKEILAALRSRRLKVSMLPFVPREHDETIAEVQAHIRRCDIVVVVPGAEQSWVQNEVAMASIVKKGLVIVRHLDDQELPASAYSGYPQFDLEPLRKDSFEPLVDYLWASLPSFVRVFGLFLVSAVRTFLISSVITMGVMFALWIVLIPLGLFFWLFTDSYTDFAAGYGALKLWIGMVVMAFVLPATFSFLIYRWMVANTIMRQAQLTGGFTVQMLAKYHDALLMHNSVIRAMPDGDYALRTAGEPGFWG